MEIVDYGGLLALNCTYTGSKIIQAFRIWLKLHNDKEWEAVDPDTGEKTYAIDVIGKLCNKSGITSTYNPKCLRAVAYMMLAEYHISNGRDDEAEYCVDVVERISYSGFTLCEDLIRDCKEWVKDTKERL